MQAVFERAAGDLGELLGRAAVGPSAFALIEAITGNPLGWKAWLPTLLGSAPSALATEALQSLSERRGAVPGWVTLIRQLANAAGNIDAYVATWEPGATESPHVAVELARRYLSAGRVAEARAALARAAPKPDRRGRLAEPDEDWETLWIEVLEAEGQSDEAQAVRWAAFQRTLSVDRARAFIGKLADFEDVETEAQAYDHAAGYKDFEKGLAFLMTWPALPSRSGRGRNFAGRLC